MTDLQHLLHQELGETERALLDSALGEGPPAGARDALLVKLGVAGATLTAAATGVVLAAPTAQASAHAAAGIAGTAGKLTGSAVTTGGAVAKWLGIGMLLGGVVSGTAATLSTPSSPPSPRVPISVQQREAPAPVARSEPARGPIVDHAVQSQASDSVVAPLHAPAAVPAPVRDRQSVIAEELALLDEARQRLARRDAAGALALIARYRQQFPAGALEPEAALIRMDALRGVGDHAAAAELARRFLADHRGSPHLERVRAQLRRFESSQAAVAPTKPGATSNVATFPEAPNR
jgi:hypothetical protein